MLVCIIDYNPGFDTLIPALPGPTFRASFN